MLNKLYLKCHFNFDAQYFFVGAEIINSGSELLHDTTVNKDDACNASCQQV